MLHSVALLITHYTVVAAAEFSFTQTDYLVYEHQLSVNACIQLINVSESIPDNALRQQILLDFRTQDMTARAGKQLLSVTSQNLSNKPYISLDLLDYTPVDSVVAFPSGHTVGGDPLCVEIEVKNDGVREGTGKEQFSVTLDNSVPQLDDDIRIETSTATVTIADCKL